MNPSDNTAGHMESFGQRLQQWITLHGLNAAPTTQHFHAEISKIIRDHWPDHHQLCHSITGEQVLEFGSKVAHYCPSRWNAVISILRFITPHGKLLPRRKLKLTRPPPPNQMEFSRLLAEADKLPRSQARIVIEFLANTGLRITGARRVRWCDVFDNRIEYVAKGGRRCAVPILESLRPILARLQTITGGTGYVLPVPHVRRGIAKACARAGLRNLTHQDFRHLFATRCIESGVDLPTVSRWVGHGDGGALLSRRYFHLMDGHSYAMAARVQIGA